MYPSLISYRWFGHTRGYNSGSDCDSSFITKNGEWISESALNKCPKSQGIVMAAFQLSYHQIGKVNQTSCLKRSVSTSNDSYTSTAYAECKHYSTSYICSDSWTKLNNSTCEKRENF